MTRNELIRATAEKSETTIKNAKAVVDALFEVIENTLVSGEDVKVTGFGTYYTILKEEHIGRNPSTNTAITIPERRYAKFKYSNAIFNALNE